MLTPEICKQHNLDYKALLEPTTIYVKQILELIKTNTITGIANITGGGLAENIKRVVPNNVELVITESKIKSLPVFDDIQRIGNISKGEMFRVFNMGVGMVVISPEQLQESADLYCIGQVQAGNGDVKIV